MNVVEQLLKIDLGQIEIPTCKKKIYLKKIKQAFEFECFAVDPEKIAYIQMKAVDMDNGSIDNIDVYKMKTRTILEGCPVFRDKKLLEHFNAATPVELIKTLMTSGEMDKLHETITDLSAVYEADENEIKN